MRYLVNREDLIRLARIVYDEACGGYMDLMEPTCDRAVQEFLPGIEILSDPKPPESPAWGGYTWGNTGVSFTTSSGHHMAMTDHIAATETEQPTLFSAVTDDEFLSAVREETFVRTDEGFVANRTETF